jgi:subtilase family serine protease
MKSAFAKTGIFLGLLSVAAAAAADATGNWSGTMSTPNGDVPVSYTFVEDGAMLTGSTTGPDGMAIAISDGKVDGDNISFVINLDFNGMPFTMAYTGVVKGDSVDFTVDIFGMPVQLTVTRAPE